MLESQERIEPVLLILDLDETLIHATKKRLSREEDFKVGDYFVYKRPALAEFLAYSLKSFRVAVWSSASDDYVKEVCSVLGLSDELEFIWGRSRATPRLMMGTDEYGRYNLDAASHFNYAKPLKKVRRKGYKIKRMLIVDDTPAKVRDNYGNAIYISPFEGDPNDNELTVLSKYLETLKYVEDVRCLEKRFWRQEGE